MVETAYATVQSEEHLIYTVSSAECKQKSRE